MDILEALLISFSVYYLLGLIPVSKSYYKGYDKWQKLTITPSITFRIQDFAVVGYKTILLESGVYALYNKTYRTARFVVRIYESEIHVFYKKGWFAERELQSIRNIIE